MKTRFELEQEILACWSVVEDIELVYQASDKPLSQDELQNALLGLQTLYQMKFERLFATFEELIRKGDIK
jgi:hypothetical protein